MIDFENIITDPIFSSSSESDSSLFIKQNNSNWTNSGTVQV